MSQKKGKQALQRPVLEGSGPAEEGQKAEQRLWRLPGKGRRADRKNKPVRNMAPALLGKAPGRIMV